MKKALFAGALALTAALAQEIHTNIEYRLVQNADPAAVAPAPGMFFFQNAEMSIDNGLVTGAPYSADAVTETTQTLADGNHIHHVSKATLYRDGAGRTRREQTLGELGPLTNSGEPVRTVVIHDPVAGTTYMIDSRSQTARKMAGKGEMGAKVMAELKARADKELTRTENSRTVVYSVGGSVAPPNHRNVKTEQLGTQIMEGVSAEGTRTTMTIPAGEIGNEQPINVVTERWYSAQLKTTVMTKTTDPRMGETVYKLQNIKLSEPDPALFAPPADYTVQ